MKLLTKEILERLPALGSLDGVDDPVVQVKFFTPWSNWTWWATEYDPETGIFFGLVSGFELEWGNFSLAELEEVEAGGLKIERDLYFDPKRVSLIPEALRVAGGV